MCGMLLSRSAHFRSGADETPVAANGAAPVRDNRGHVCTHARPLPLRPARRVRRLLRCSARRPRCGRDGRAADAVALQRLRRTRRRLSAAQLALLDQAARAGLRPGRALDRPGDPRLHRGQRLPHRGHGGVPGALPQRRSGGRAARGQPLRPGGRQLGLRRRGGAPRAVTAGRGPPARRGQATGRRES
ncbi:hypothetical protein SCOCK_260031 [Actinacidiphila cocklensis]|uniref:Uncharacterized protein n=1 Tax=Actinacidiphila cocklensis TaxID=887465 RepID=A0A9W4GRF0_9ACTN|nr:hypothetical protein SCOCK_260031 [Actinacidiphila cocklensis]